MIAIVHWRLRAKTHPGGEVVSIVMNLFAFLAAVACLTWTAWSSCDVH